MPVTIVGRAAGRTRLLRVRRQLDQPGARFEGLLQLRSDLQRQPRLTGTADSDQRDQSRATEQIAHHLELTFTPNERRALERQTRSQPGQPMASCINRRAPSPHGHRQVQRNSGTS